MPPLSGASRSLADQVKIFGPAILITLIGFVVAYQFVDPAPPRRISIATGGTDGAYYVFAHAYKKILAGEDIELEVHSTAGSLANIALLEDAAERVDVAFVQGGTGSAYYGDNLISLASLYFEPLWVFHRRNAAFTRLAELRHKRIAVGVEGSGTRAIAMQLLHDNDVGSAQAKLVPLGGHQAVEALFNAEVDAVFLVASPKSSAVRALLEAPGIELMSFERAEAYTRLHRFLSRVTLPQGVIDLQANIPPEDIALLAPTANLVASRELHPALVDLLLQAARRTHGPGGLFEASGQFPSAAFIEFPLSDEARRFFKSGPPFLQRFLPFWAATLVDRMLVMLLPLVALLFPLVRAMPPIYRWRMRARIYRWYRELLALDPILHKNADRTDLERCLSELDRIEDELSRVHVPMSYADQLYHLRLHLELVRDKLTIGLSRAEQVLPGSDPGD